MKKEEWNNLKSLIDNAKVISFDMFDTLLYRKVNSPETIFDIIGNCYGINGFRKLRMETQDQASKIVYEKYGYPHADMNDIYNEMKKHTEFNVDWDEVKQFEIELERDALVANCEMKTVYEYAKAQGKRVIVVSDMYLLKDTLKIYLDDNGYSELDNIYCSADEHVAKFNKLLYERVVENEGIEYSELLHIGDNQYADVDIPKEYGINTYLYKTSADIDKIATLDDSDIDKGLYKILYDENKGFWYNLGVEVGGPLYLSLYDWLINKKENKKIYFLARDGYNLYHIFKKHGINNAYYLEVSRRSLLLAGITDIDDETLELLPPYTFGQTVGEIWDYLCISKKDISFLDKVGFSGFDYVIKSIDDIIAFKKLYEYNRDVFLNRCDIERENAVAYFEKMEYFSGDCIFFDCGWQGTSQVLMERFNKAVNYNKKTLFYYYGIRNTSKSRKQLHGLRYDTFLFDFWRNYALQSYVDEAIVLYEMFFSSPNESVYYYGEGGNVIYEEGKGDEYKKELLEGIIDYLDMGIPFKHKYNIDTPPELSVTHLQRLIREPNESEALMVGNIENVDGFARKIGEHKYIAKISYEQLEKNPNIEIYWLNGLLNRTDIEEEIKVKCAQREGIIYPKTEEPLYHLEGENALREYHRWLKNQSQNDEIIQDLSYNPMFSVVIPVYNTVTEQLKECIESVLCQTYSNFELILVDDHSSWDNVVPVLKSYEDNEKVKIIYRNMNGHISVATNDAINISCGEYIVFMDCDDTIEPNALFEFAKLLNEHPEYDFIYSDEDKITEDGKIRHMPFFKPDWSPDLFLCMMYTNHLATYRASVVKEIGGLRSAFNGSQDYDMTLRFMEKSDNTKVGHISKILYHWRERKESVAFAMGSKNYAAYAARDAKMDYLRRNNIEGRVEYIPGMSQYRVVYDVIGNPLVSIIIPSKDHPDILRQCVDSILRCTSYNNYEIIVVDNGSNEFNKEIISNYLFEKNVKYLYNTFEFNFSKMCNIGRYNAEGEYLLFLNDDIEILQADWLERMIGQAQRKHVGAVGAKLLYPKTTLIQHAGVSNMVKGPSHDFLKCDDSIQHYFGLNWLDSDRIAVTAACMLLSVDNFDLVGGFEESLPVAYNDVSLCFALYEKGLYNVVRNDVVAYHHESLSRGYDLIDKQKKLRMEKELGRLYNRFYLLYKRDPFLNPSIFHFSNELLLLRNFDNVVIDNNTNITNGEDVVIDSIGITDFVYIVGWSRITPELVSEGYKRYIIFADPYGHQYLAETMSMKREDVVEVFGGDESYLYSGFECKIAIDALALNSVPYKIGLCTVYGNDRHYVTWCTQIDIQSIKPSTVLSEGHKLYDELNDELELKYNVCWNLDECSQQNDMYVIRGYAFLDKPDNYNYKRTLLLKGSKHTYEYQVYDDCRPDVALAYADKNFIVETGFISRILREEIDADTYELILKFINRYDVSNVQYVDMNEIIQVC